MMDMDFQVRQQTASGGQFPAALAFVLAALLVHCLDDILGAIYHVAFPLMTIAMVLLLAAGVLCGVMYACQCVMPRAIVVAALNFCGIQLFAYWIYTSLRKLFLVDGAMPLPLKIAIALMLLGGALWLIRHDSFARIRRAMTFSCLLIILTPPVLAEISSGPQAFPLKPLPPEVGQGSNVVVLLLDELTDSAVEPVIAALQHKGLYVAHVSAEPAGKNTINAIPALLTGQDFSDAQPCSVSIVCSGRRVLDFSKMTSVEKRLDIVGFHHPYCRIMGLRYCFQANTPGGENPLVWIACVITRAVYKDGIPVCRSQPLSVSQVTVVRAALWNGVLQAPFWRDGGVMFMHLPLPHPPGNSAEGTLDADYASTLQMAASVAGNLAEKMRQKFGDDFTLIVTSDHPLRPHVWCKLPRYASKDCAVRPEFIAATIPVLIAANHPVDSGAAKREKLFGLVDYFRGAGARP